MALARHKLTGLVEDLRDDILDHPELGRWFNRLREGSSDKPLVSYQVGDKAPIEDTDASDEDKAAEAKPEESPVPLADPTFGDLATTETN